MLGAIHNFVVCGEKQVGKTQLINKIADNNFELDYVATDERTFTTLKIDHTRFIFYEFPINALNIKLFFHFKPQTDFILFCFDAHDRNSFDNMSQLIGHIKDLNKDPMIKFILIETKADLENTPRVVSLDMINELKDKYSIDDYIETSAASGYGIEKIKDLFNPFLSVPIEPIEEILQEEPESFFKFNSQFLLRVVCAATGLALVIAAIVMASVFSLGVAAAVVGCIGLGVLLASGLSFFKSNFHSNSLDELVCGPLIGSTGSCRLSSV